MIFDFKIHTVEFTYFLDNQSYKLLYEYFFYVKKKCYTENNTIYFHGFTDRGIRVEMNTFYNDNRYLFYKIKYIITPSRFKDNDNYLELTEPKYIIDILNDIGEYLKNTNKLLPIPLECILTRIDFTHDFYTGENTTYIIKLLNRCFLPKNYIRLQMPTGRYYKNNATIIKYRKNSFQKIFGVSFYDKYEEMVSHRNYDYSPEILNSAKGILRAEFRLYNARIKNMKYAARIKDTEKLLNLLSNTVNDIIYKNMRRLYLLGNFYKLDKIIDIINNSRKHDKTKKIMIDFIRSAADHKSADIAARDFEQLYGYDILKKLIAEFNSIGIIPVPIAVSQNFDKWEMIKKIPAAK